MNFENEKQFAILRRKKFAAKIQLETQVNPRDDSIIFCKKFPMLLNIVKNFCIIFF